MATYTPKNSRYVKKYSRHMATGDNESAILGGLKFLQFYFTSICEVILL